VLDWHVSNWVFAIAVSGAVGGVKFAVYTAVPLTTRALDIKPLNGLRPAVVDAPITRLSVEVYTLPAAVNGVPEETPFTYKVQVFAFRTNATCVQVFAAGVAPFIIPAHEEPVYDTYAIKAPLLNAIWGNWL
jgi:hypothetical protein